MTDAWRFTVRGTVQGVGFRPFVARLASAHRLSGWVLNGQHGVEIHVEGPPVALDAFARALRTESPPASHLEGVDVASTTPIGLATFEIRESHRHGSPTALISPDLPICDECLEEMLDPDTRRFEYPYINCTNCGPRYSLVTALPYDRERTTMAPWPRCSACEREYRDRCDRRFHAEPIACPECGPRYRLIEGHTTRAEGRMAVRDAARLLREGAILAIKGIGGYHLCCGAANAAAVAALRARKYRKSRPFAVMVRNVDIARCLVDLDPSSERLLASPARPIVLVSARVSFGEVAPGRRDLGLMLPYAPIHHLLFRAGAPDVLVMTSANRSSEPIAYRDADAVTRLSGIADAFLTGERAIARRIDDSVVRSDDGTLVILRRARGYAPAVVARLPASRPILAVGADLKNSITLVVGGEAIVSQHLGDLEYLSAREAFTETIRDLGAMYELDWSHVTVAHDSHPHYASTACALDLPTQRRIAVQHHRAHVASVLVEHKALDTRVVGVAFDGTGYGDDGTIWGGEFFVGSVTSGLGRVASLRPFPLPGGDAAARWPLQAAAGVLHDVGDNLDLTAPPFALTSRFRHARQLVSSGVRTFISTSAGRLFDAVAATLGFLHENEYEGQAAEWLEQLAWQGPHECEPLPFALTERHVDLTEALQLILKKRASGADVAALARAFHETVAASIAAMAARLCEDHGVGTVVLSGGTFQNTLLVQRVRSRLAPGMELWTNSAVPSNDGGISLGQAAFACVAQPQLR